MSLAIAFAKYQGTGNDFLVIDCRAGLAAFDEARVARWLCDRHFGVGADGLLLVSTGETAAFRMRVVNADGSVPEMCGNGLRCVARYLSERGEVTTGAFDVETGAGIRTPEVLSDGQVRVDMGVPGLTRALIPMTGDPTAHVIEEPLGLEANTVLVTAVSMGNPHAVIFVRDVEAVPLADWGPRLEQHPAFPQGANIEFVQIIDPTHARMRVWERGSGITLACGTGACATLVAGVLTGKLQREALITLPGGPLALGWDARDHVWLTGAATHVYDGRVTLPAELFNQEAL